MDETTTPPPVFDTEKCPVPYVPRVSSLTADTTVAEPPPPIDDCSRFEPPPLPDPPPCPAVTLDDDPGDEDGIIRGGTIRFDCDEEREEPFIELKIEKRECCAFDFALDIVLPCPVLTVETAEITTFKTDDYDANPSMTFTIARCPNPDPEIAKCAFEFSLDIDVPIFCPTIGTGNIIIATTGIYEQPYFDISILKNPDDCSFAFDLELRMPSCIPELTVGTETISTTDILSPPYLAFAITKPDPYGCAFVFDLEIIVPVCNPELTVTSVLISTTDILSPPYASLYIARPDPAECAFEFELSIVVPVCNPTLAVGSRWIATTDINSPPYLDFTIAQGVYEPCSFVFDVGIVIPTCTPELVVGSVTASTGETAGLTLTIDEDPYVQCRWILDAAITFPSVPSIGLCVTRNEEGLVTGVYYTDAGGVRHPLPDCDESYLCWTIYHVSTSSLCRDPGLDVYEGTLSWNSATGWYEDSAAGPKLIGSTGPLYHLRWHPDFGLQAGTDPDGPNYTYGGCSGTCTGDWCDDYAPGSSGVTVYGPLGDDTPITLYDDSTNPPYYKYHVNAGCSGDVSTSGLGCNEEFFILVRECS